MYPLLPTPLTTRPVAMPTQCAPPAAALANILGACPKAEKTVQTISFSLAWLSKKCDKLHHC